MEIVINKQKYFQKNEKEFLAYLHRKNGKHLDISDLNFSFHDLAGNSYYKFPKEMGLPMVRLGKLHGYIKYLSAGVSGAELETLVAQADKALSEGIKSGKNAAKIGFILTELVERKGLIVHDELFYNIIAVQIIRHDESPTVFNNDIHLEKVKEFRRLNEENDTFFLNINEYLTALNWSNITREELLNILSGSATRRKATLEIVEKVYGKLSDEQRATLSSL